MKSRLKNIKLQLNDLLQYLESRAVALEETSFGTTKDTSSSFTTLTVTPSLSLHICKFYKLSQHKIFKCDKFQSSPVKVCTNYVNQNKLCKICLNFHKGKGNYKFKCILCQNLHNALLHEDNIPQQKGTLPVILISNSKQINYHLLPTAKVHVIGKNGQKLCIRAILHWQPSVMYH